MKYEEIEKIVKNSMSEKRFKHCLGVSKRAVELAKIYGIDEEKAKLVGIAHDIAKEMPKDKAIEYVKENEIILDEIEKREMGLWHSKIGADICGKEFGFSEDMKQAIRYHTTGNPNMTIFDKIIYIADKTDETRKNEELIKAREISNTDLNEGILYIAKRAINYSIEKESLIHPDTIYLINSIILEKENN